MVVHPVAVQLVGEGPLIFTCCHPALSRGARVALTLRLLGGLSAAEIARVLGPAPAPADACAAGQFYHQLLALAPSPVAALNRAGALAEVDGPPDGLVAGWSAAWLVRPGRERRACGGCSLPGLRYWPVAGHCPPSRSPTS